MATTITVGIIGFSTPEQVLFKKIFQLSEQRQRLYVLTELTQSVPVQLLIIKKTTENTALYQTYQAKHAPKIPTVLVGRDPPLPEERYYIRGVLVPSRVFAVLDQVELLTTTSEAKSPERISKPRLETRLAAEPIAPVSAVEALQVLVVDDSVMMQKTVQLELNKADVPLAVDFAETGEIALEKIQLKKYDFIFLDVMMPGIDGFETCSRIRKCKGMAKVPIIMLTSKTSPADEVKGLMAGCTTYLTKPFVHEDFQKMLKRITRWVKEFNERK